MNSEEIKFHKEFKIDIRKTLASNLFIIFMSLLVFFYIYSGFQVFYHIDSFFVGNKEILSVMWIIVHGFSSIKLLGMIGQPTYYYEQRRKYAK